METLKKKTDSVFHLQYITELRESKQKNVCVAGKIHFWPVFRQNIDGM